ncbi:MAG: diguanylate cyclase [Anaerolineales bacterium]|nr:diguanylate cyclase [Chloroflexota bacterium]MBL6981902.1 diguanylate cyclase [Anaerolineales bacterium]
MNEFENIRQIFKNINFDSDNLCFALINSMGDGLVAVDNDGIIRLINPIGEILTGWPSADVMGQNISQIYKVRDLEQGISLKRIPLLKVFEEKDTFSVQNRFLLARRDGTHIPISETATPIVDKEGKLVGAILVFREISDSLDAESRIEYLATHDYLTGLPNRRLFIDRLDMALTQSRREYQKLGILFIDLNDFKPMNDAYGHEFGDAVLKRVARELLGSVRESDTVARIGGDEFAIILTNLNDRKDLLPAISKVIKTFKQSLTIKGRLTEISISVGDALYPDDAEDIDVLLDHADKLMYAHKIETKLNRDSR